MVSIAAFQAVDPGSIPGRRRFFFFFFYKTFLQHLGIKDIKDWNYALLKIFSSIRSAKFVVF